MVMTPPSDSSSPGSPSLQPMLGVPRAELYARPNSHPFQNRVLLFTGPDQQIKVGRSVARSKPSPNNGIFDCKVLSRNHALIWYENGKFYLQDTKSSNGTFVNNQRLSKGSEESLPREVCSGDILQFGVDVVENSRKVTHGCIIATLKLYLPDGKEAKASPTIVSSVSSTSLPTQDLYQLHHYIQEALAREQLLENKLAALQRLVGQTESASSDAWKSLIDEDRLLTRVEILESQLSTYGKSVNEDKLREEAIRLMEEKERYQETAKDTLKKLVDEKLDTMKRLSDIERSLSNTEDEFSTLKELYDREVDENRKLAEEISRLSTQLEEKIGQDEAADVEAPTSDETQNNKSERVTDVDVDGDGDGDGDGDVGSADRAEKESDGQLDEVEIVVLKEKLSILTQELSEARQRYEDMSQMTHSYREELEETKDRLRDALDTLDRKDQALDELEMRQSQLMSGVVCGAPSDDARPEPGPSVDVAKPEVSPVVEREPVVEVVTLSQEEREAFESLKEEISKLTSVLEENERLQEELKKSESSSEKIAQLESALLEAETKISDLIRVKEKFAELSEESHNQTLNLTELESEFETLNFQSRVSTCLAVFPLLVLCFAVVVAYLPIFSTVFGTADRL